MVKSTVSVALCAFNGARFIREQLESILAQTRPPDEIVVCDDGSTDGTLAIVRDIGNQWSGILHLIQNPCRLGVTRNFEQAIAMTTGDIIFSSDQDDVWFPDRIAAMLRPFEDDAGIGMVHSDAVMVDERLKSTGRRFSQYLSLARYRQPSPGTVVRCEGEVAGCLTAFRSDLKPLILPVVDGWVYDHSMVLIAHATSRVRSIDRPLMFHRRHDANASGGEFFRRRFLDDLKAAQRVSHIGYYTDDRRQWDAMVRRLSSLSSLTGMRLGANLPGYLNECRNRLAFAHQRERLRSRKRLVRLTPLVNQLVAGRYHRYVRGFRSFGKDLLM